MRHPYEKFIRMELLALVSVIFLGLIAFIKSWVFLVFISLFLLALSITFDALVQWHTYQKASAGKQLIRGLMIIFLTIYLLFKL